MCRTGGRRCENHWSQAQKDADNARRRAIYAARKGTLKAVETPLPNLTIQQAVTSTLNTYEKPTDMYCYAPETVSGHIDVSSLDDNSYTQYGFANPDETYDRTSGEVLNKHRLPSLDHAKENSHDETESFTYKERAAMTIFTGDGHRDINLVYFESPKARLFNPVHPSKFDPVHDYQFKTEDGKTERISNLTFDERIDRQRAKLTDYPLNSFIADNILDSVQDQAYSEEAMVEYTQELDSAFTKASGNQRVVYRGEAWDAEHHKLRGKSLAQHIQEEYTVGSKKRMKGVQSTSLNKDTAFNFAQAHRKESIIYEIRSPSGINITSLSTFDHEREVLLPRNSEYIVVGSKMITSHKGHQVAVIQMIEVDENDNIRTKDNLRTEFGEVNYERLRRQPKENV